MVWLYSTTHVVCFTLMHEWWSSLISTSIDSLRSFCEKSAERKTLKEIFTQVSFIKDELGPYALVSQNNTSFLHYIIASVKKKKQIHG